MDKDILDAAYGTEFANDIANAMTRMKALDPVDDTKEHVETKEHVDINKANGESTETPPENVEIKSLDTTSDNSNEGEELSEGSIDNLEKGAIVRLVKTDDTYSITTDETDDSITVAKLSELPDLTTGEYILHGYTSADKSATFSGVVFSIENTDVEKGTCSLKWTKGNVVTTSKESTSTEDTPATRYKGLSVAEQLWDTPVSWEFEDIFYAFLSCCYKLGIAAEVNDQEPSPDQYNALIEEMAQLMKQVVGADADADLADDMFKAFIARFTNNNILIKQVKLLPMTTKGGSRHNSTDKQTIKDLHQGLVKLDETVCGTEDKEATANELVELKKQLEEAQKVADEKSSEVTRLEAELTQKTAELDTIVPTQKQSVELGQLLGITSPVAATKSFANEDEFISNLYGV